MRVPQMHLIKLEVNIISRQLYLSSEILQNFLVLYNQKIVFAPLKCWKFQLAVNVKYCIGYH